MKSDTSSYVNVKSAMPLICYDFIFPVFSVLICKTGDIDTSLVRLLLGFEVMCVEGSAHAAYLVFNKQMPRSTSEGSCQICSKFQSCPRYSTSQSTSHMAAVWYLVYFYSIFSKKDLRQLGVQQIFAKWWQTIHSSQMFFLPFSSFHNKQNTPILCLFKCF